MGLYSRYVFPIIMEWTLKRPKIMEYRQELLSKVRGKVLEIGFGTGLNLPYYPKTVQELHVVDPNPGMKRKAGKRIKNSSIPVIFKMLSSEKLPYENQFFDHVVSTWTLCSIPDVEVALWEIHRVLKPEGKIFFIEHGLSPDSKVKKWQRRLTPWQIRFADGCHLDRDMGSLIEDAGFRILEIKNFYHPGFPKVGGYFYQGIAQKT